MKLKFKTLVAAVALAAAGHAGATISTAGNNNAELFLSVWSPTLGGGTGYTRDLGVTIGSFLPTSANVQFGATNGGTETWSNATHTGSIVANTVGSVINPGYLLSFQTDDRLTGSGLLGAADTIWVVGALRTGASPTLLSTVSNATYANATAGTVGDNVGNITTTYEANVNATGSHPNTTAINGSDTALALVSGSPNAAFPGGTGFGQSWGGNVNFSSAALIGQSMSFLALSGTNQFDTTIAQYANGLAQWTLSANGTLAFAVPQVAAPVPEPSTWAMLAAGLALVGGIARRRMAS